ncbi:hypothetical protein [Kitasatospora sp. NPDC091207]|uniref:hypothetical protein n=1 Tax=Kitasatospora sp. NPDC091207 TaxID=3364083 RepID=UPI00380E2149
MTGSQEPQAGPSLPEQRSARHAAPRTPVRIRLRGRALAMAAVPTALLMAAAYTPNTAIAETSAGKPCATAPETVPDVAPVEETPVPKDELTPLPGPSTAPTGAATAPTTVPTTVPTPGPTAAPTTAAPTTAAPTTAAPTGAVPTTAAPSGPAAPAPTTGAAKPAAARSATGGSGGVAQAGLIDDLVGGITHLINPSGSPSPSAGQGQTPGAGQNPGPSTGQAGATAPSAAGAPAPGARAAAPAAQPSQDPQAPPSPAAPQAPAATTAATQPPAATSGKASPKASTSGKASPKAAPTAGAGSTPSPSGSPSANPNCEVDARGLTAGAPAPGHVVPEQNWTLRTSRLGLHGAVFHGVYDVRTPTGTKRVLKFVVDSVDIENLDMSTLEGNGKTFHVKGAPGSTSTMRQGPVTMYVERLSGHLSKLLGLPIPIDLGEITLTPDTLPRWLYDLIGAIPIPLDLELTGVTAKQAGQFGGTLKIPGMHLYNDDEPYSDK